MPGLADALRGHRLVGLDTPVFIYQIERVRPYFALTNEIFAALSEGAMSAVTSVLTLMEVTVLPLRTGRPPAADDYEAIVLGYPNLDVIVVDQQIARRAAELRAAYNLAAIDAVQVASAILSGASAYVSNDRRLQRVAEVEVVFLDDFL